MNERQLKQEVAFSKKCKAACDRETSDDHLTKAERRLIVKEFLKLNGKNALPNGISLDDAFEQIIF